MFVKLPKTREASRYSIFIGIERILNARAYYPSQIEKKTESSPDQYAARQAHIIGKTAAALIDSTRRKIAEKKTLLLATAEYTIFQRLKALEIETES